MFLRKMLMLLRQQNVANAEAESEKVQESIDDFLHILASKAPDGMFNTITRQATSFEWVFARIKTAFRIQSKGVDLFTATEEGFDEENDSSTDVSFMKMKGVQPLQQAHSSARPG